MRQSYYRRDPDLSQLYQLGKTIDKMTSWKAAYNTLKV